MKKFTAVLLAALLCIMSFAGCAQTASDPQSAAPAESSDSAIEETSAEVSEEAYRTLIEGMGYGPEQYN